MNHIYAGSPDILHRASNTALESIRIPTGDIIHLKDVSLPWYTGPLAKHGRVDTEEPSVEPTLQTVFSYERGGMM